MKILIVYNSALDSVSVSGVQRHYADVVSEWTKQGHTVDFWVAKGAFPAFRTYFPNSRLISSDSLFSFSAKKLHQRWRYLPAFAWRMITPLFTKLPDTYDVIFACAQFIYEVVPAMQLARQNRSTLAVWVHHVLSTQHGRTGFFDRLQCFAERLSTRLINRHFHVVLVNTVLNVNDFRDLEMSLGLKPSNVHTTGACIRMDQVPFVPRGKKTFDAIVLGRVHQHKGVFDLPDLWRLVRQVRPNARLAVVGDGPHRRALIERFADYGMGPDSGGVYLPGGVSDEVKNEVLATSRVGLSLSKEEGWGLSVMECLAAGLPVVAMKLPVFDVVFPNLLDQVAQGDINSMANRILHWIDHPLPETAALQNRAFVERYDHRVVAKRELDVLINAHATRKHNRSQ